MFAAGSAAMCCGHLWVVPAGRMNGAHAARPQNAASSRLRFPIPSSTSACGTDRCFFRNVAVVQDRLVAELRAAAVVLLDTTRKTTMASDAIAPITRYIIGYETCCAR